MTTYTSRDSDGPMPSSVASGGANAGPGVAGEGAPGPAPGLTEAQWQQQVVGIAKQYRWTCFHPVRNQPTARGHKQQTEPGWPDLVLLGHSRALFVELKAEKGRVRPEQTRTLELLTAAGCETALWRPSDLPTVLDALGPRQRRLPIPNHVTVPGRTLADDINRRAEETA
jgi:hypothetical protein